MAPAEALRLRRNRSSTSKHVADLAATGRACTSAWALKSATFFDKHSTTPSSDDRRQARGRRAAERPTALRRSAQRPTRQPPPGGRPPPRPALWRPRHKCRAAQAFRRRTITWLRLQFLMRRLKYACAARAAVLESVGLRVCRAASCARVRGAMLAALRHSWGAASKAAGEWQGIRLGCCERLSAAAAAAARCNCRRCVCVWTDCVWGGGCLCGCQCKEQGRVGRRYKSSAGAKAKGKSRRECVGARTPSQAITGPAGKLAYNQVQRCCLMININTG